MTSHLLLLQTLVRLGAYQSLDLTISEALNQRSPDFPGVVICTAGDSLGTLLQLIKKRRVHRLVVVEGEVGVRSGLSCISHLYWANHNRAGGREKRREERTSTWHNHTERRPPLRYW
jgi:5'-AMP-activated protein kinase regulatory gamma subunit